MDKSKPKLTVLVGIPGTGKSTIVGNKFKNAFVYSTDNYIEEVAKEQGKTYSQVFKSQIKPAKRAMDILLSEAIEGNKDIVWDQTNMSSSKRISILKKFPDEYVKECLVVRPPKMGTVDWKNLEVRLASREGKDIPMHIVTSMVKNYEEPDFNEGWDIITIVDMYGYPISAEKRQ